MGFWRQKSHVAVGVSWSESRIINASWIIAEVKETWSGVGEVEVRAYGVWQKISSQVGGDEVEVKVGA